MGLRAFRGFCSSSWIRRRGSRRGRRRRSRACSRATLLDPDFVITDLTTGRFRDILQGDEFVGNIVERQWFPVIRSSGAVLVETKEEEGRAVTRHVETAADHRRELGLVPFLHLEFIEAGGHSV